ncbi:hypothetical protein ACRRTK_005212 [Alexandromys fortis]
MLAWGHRQLPTVTVSPTSLRYRGFILFCLRQGLSLHSPDCSGTHCADQIGLKLTKLLLPLPLKCLVKVSLTKALCLFHGILGTSWAVDAFPPGLDSGTLGLLWVYVWVA